MKVHTSSGQNGYPQLKRIGRLSVSCWPTSQHGHQKKCLHRRELDTAWMVTQLAPPLTGPSLFHEEKNTHRGARTHDHKVKGLALCRLS